MIVPISRNTIMSLEFSMMNASMQVTRIVLVMAIGKISALASINVSCVTDEWISLIQSPRVKAFPPSLHPRQAFGGVFLPSNALNSVRKLQQ
jgi:hypothetical protein